MSRLNILTFGASVMALSVAAYAALREPDTNVGPAAAPQTTEPVEQPQGGQDHELSSRVAGLEAMVVALSEKKSVEPGDEREEASADAEPEGMPSELNDMASPEELRYEDEQHRDRLETALANEAIDQNWAKSLEKELVVDFAAEELAGSRLVDVSCRTTLCKMEIEHEDRDHQLGFPDKLMASEGGKKGAGAWGMEVETDGRFQTVVYLAREGYGENLDLAPN